MKIKMIWAQDSNCGIGKCGGIPWYCPEDLRYFKEKTTGNCVIMGRKTWDSLPNKVKPLPNRLNVVVSRTLIQSDFPEGVLLAHSIEHAIELAKVECHEIAWFIGGGEMYKQAMLFATECHITKIAGNFECDAFAPELMGDWIIKNVETKMACTGLDVVHVDRFIHIKPPIKS